MGDEREVDPASIDGPPAGSEVAQSAGGRDGAGSGEIGDWKPLYSVRLPLLEERVRAPGPLLYVAR